jgi:hypothetical protein
MTPEQGKDGRWFITLEDGQRVEFESNAAAWRWIDRAERRESWVSSRAQWRMPATYALPKKGDDE